MKYLLMTCALLASHCKAIDVFDKVAVSGTVCWNASDPTQATIFNPPRDGEIQGFSIQYSSGGSTCNRDTISVTNWGCNNFMMTSLIRLSDQDSKTGRLYFPTDDIDGLISKQPIPSCPSCPVQHVEIKQTYGDSAEVIMRASDTRYQVTTTDKFAIQWCEAICDVANTDNDGRTCGTVSFLYSKTDYQLIKASDEACFSTANDGGTASGTLFNAPINGTIQGVLLVHKSGAMSCDGANPNSNWGCVTWPSAGGSAGVIVERVTNTTTKTGTTIYPTDDTDGFNPGSIPMWASCNSTIAYESYNIEGMPQDGPRLLFHSTADTYAVTTADQFAIQNFWAQCNFFVGDDWGTSCAKVYFLYSKVTEQCQSEDFNTRLETHSIAVNDVPSMTWQVGRFTINN